MTSSFTQRKLLLKKFDIMDKSSHHLQEPTTHGCLTDNLIFLNRVTAKVDMMKMFGSAGSDGKMPLMITSQDDKPGKFCIEFKISQITYCLTTIKLRTVKSLGLLIKVLDKANKYTSKFCFCCKY